MNYIVVSLLVVVAIFSSYLVWNNFLASRVNLMMAPQNGSVQKIPLKIGENTFMIEAAVDEASRTYGLMNRAHMPEKEGMLFVFDMTGLYPFWMKDTLIPLDMIWINSNKEIVYIYENAQPCKNIMESVCSTVVPKARAKYVLELNAGEVQKYGIKVGDKVEVAVP